MELFKGKGSLSAIASYRDIMLAEDVVQTGTSHELAHEPVHGLADPSNIVSVLPHTVFDVVALPANFQHGLPHDGFGHLHISHAGLSPHVTTEPGGEKVSERLGARMT